MDKYAHLNPQQREAALHGEGPLLILAGAGSGKTAVMTHRIAHLIEDEGVKPWNILAVTFTNKAAAEMRERVAKLLDGDSDAVWIMTFHAVCLRILRRHAERLGYKKDFVVYDPTDQKAVAKRVVKALDYDPKRFSPAYVLGQISKYKEQLKTPAQIRETSESSYAQGLKDMAEVYARYEKALRANNAMDFDDLLWNAVKLFEKEPEVLEEYRRRWRYVLVDEYQDTNRVQERLIDLVRGGAESFFVGDVKQSIYRFRNAEPDLFLSKYDSFPVGAGGTGCDARVDLNANFRSRREILDAVNGLFELLMEPRVSKMEYSEDARLVPGDSNESARKPDDERKVKLRIETRQNGEAHAYGEALAVADELKRLVGKPFTFFKKEEKRK